MARDSVGEIALDLSLNSNGFKKQLSGIADMAKKAGAMIASAFAVKKLVEFGKSCIELGSDLSEVQNVVDVTFPQMSAQVDQFAKSAPLPSVCRRQWPRSTPVLSARWRRRSALRKSKPIRWVHL